MRIWDLQPDILCRQHLLGEHRELHALWSIVTQDKKGYRQHPETVRWEGKMAALYLRHEALVKEMGQRGYMHKTPLDKDLATGSPMQEVFLHSLVQQREILRQKACACKIEK